MRNNSKKRF